MSSNEQNQTASQSEQIPASLSQHVGFIDEKELLKILPISRRTLFEWRTSGKIPSIKIGRRVLFHPASVVQAVLRLQTQITI